MKQLLAWHLVCHAKGRPASRSWKLIVIFQFDSIRSNISQFPILICSLLEDAKGRPASRSWNSICQGSSNLQILEAYYYYIVSIRSKISQSPIPRTAI
ncbi:hypothetical protein SADUNF_Sadunf18G0032800 [Salix dunnii]|uniref:Uncharacterized protein n=1 Tax=Salix dunnii TaxID=1413687 RepID=A0A835MDB4_9ROSI|nr:hypothetical protein SADUNF_Sadunf18G0032800 [Salix dunnii]